MLNDTRIIGRLGAYDVLAHRYELYLPDGTLRQLHDVARSGVADKFLRAVARGAGTFTVVDVRRLAPSLADSLPSAPERDRPGLVFYAIKSRYAGATQFNVAVDSFALVHGRPFAAEAVPQ